jgi:hypothetical protein
MEFNIRKETGHFHPGRGAVFRTDFTHTVTIPNHTCMATGRPVLQPDGQPNTVHHGYTNNGDPALASGVYLVRLEALGISSGEKLLILK